MMSSSNILSDEKVIVASMECIKQVINKLDAEQGGLRGIETVLEQFTVNDMISNPGAVLDSLIIYLFCVHSVDWYSDTWDVAYLFNTPS